MDSIEISSDSEDAKSESSNSHNKNDINFSNIEKITNKKTYSNGFYNLSDLSDEEYRISEPLSKRLNLESSKNPTGGHCKQKEIAKRKEIEKQLRADEKKQKKEEAERAKAIKQVLNTANKNIKPDECIKFIKIRLSEELNGSYKGATDILEENGINFSSISQIFSNTVTWIRDNQTHYLDDNGKISQSSTQEETEEVLLILNIKEFLNHVLNKSLSEYCNSIKSALNKNKLFLILFGLNKYFRYREKIRSQTSDLENSSQKYPNVRKSDIETALTELQIFLSISYRNVETVSQLGQVLVQFTKSIAQIPYKKQRSEKDQQNEWFAAGDNKDCVRVDRDGNGLSRLWKQSLTVFPLARLEVAETISAEYPNLNSLFQAYDKCETLNECEKLLQDLPIRRTAGKISNARRLGPELSKKIGKFFNSLDPDVAL